MTSPTRAQWTDAATGLPCLAHRGPCGALCGYVGVPEGHPWHGKPYGTVDAQAHGGLTFSDRCVEAVTDDGHGICHKVEPGEDDAVWWLGFDCAHAGDLCPQTSALLRRVGHPVRMRLGETYRDLAYVQSECAALAAQIAEVVA